VYNVNLSEGTSSISKKNAGLKSATT